MLLSDYLTPALQESLQSLTTAHGFTFEALTRSGRENPDSSVGAYAGDAESYELFAPLLLPLISAYHQKESL